MTANELDDEYRRNDYNDKLVQALNRIGDEDREILIRYIANRFKTAPTARQLNIQYQTLRLRLYDIRHNIINEYEKILNSDDDWDYRIDWLKRHETKPERPIIQANLFDWTPIAKYASLEQAANAVNGNAKRIQNVCNGHGFKYLGTRWFWETDWKKIQHK